MPDVPRLIVNLTRGSVLAEQVLLADTPLPRMRGLLGRGALRPGEGILLQPAPSIHTAFVRFRFDAVFLDMNLRVVRVAPRVKAWRAVSARRAASVLQLAAGEAERRGVEVGDQILVSDPAPAATAVPVAAPARGDGAVPDATRVLLIAADRRYRSTTSALLQRRGYEVAVSERAGELTERVADYGADVVVLDAGSLPSVATLEMARLDAANPLVGFVVVGERLAQPAPSISMVPKWGSFEDLVEAIDGARVAPAA
jgi:uncharacterized membrane protein (UPF0127 family)